MSRPRLLDLFSCEGGAAVGYGMYQSLPPVYTAHIGTQLLAHLEGQVAA